MNSTSTKADRAPRTRVGKDIVAATVDLTMAIRTALDECAGPALDGALAGIAEAFGIPEADIRRLAGLTDEGLPDDDQDFRGV